MKKTVYLSIKHFILIFLSFLAVFPVYWLVVSSLKNEGDIYNTVLVPIHATLNNYSYAFKSIPIKSMLMTSFVVSSSITLFQIITSVFASYAFIRWNFRGSKIIYGLIMMTWLVPFQAIMIPNYVQITAFHLQGKTISFILPFVASAFAIISMFQSFNSFPKALIEAARLDGSSEFQILFNIILPSMKATLSSLAILLFINSWNEYLWPMLVAKDASTAPIQIGLRSFIGSDTNLWGTLMAATTISCIPILIIYLIFQKHIVDSFMKWGIK